MTDMGLTCNSFADDYGLYCEAYPTGLIKDVRSTI